MSFSRVKPDGWAVNEKLTSAQQNQLDIDHAKAVDKTGDTITGNVHIGNGARITVDSGGKIVNASGGIVELQSGSNTNYLTGATATWNNGAFLTVTGGGQLTVTDSALTIGGTSVFTVGGSVTTTFNGSIAFNGSGVLGSSLLNVQSGAEIRVKTGSRIYFENGSSVTFDTTVGIDMLADIAFGSGHVSSYPNGAQIFYQGASTHTSTSTDTYQNGSTLTHASGSSETYESGASLAQASGAAWTLSGATSMPGTFTAANGSTITHANGSTETWASGAVVSFTAVPTFSNGFSSVGGTTSFTSSVSMSGTTTIVGGTNRLKLTPRTKTKRIPLSSGIAEVVFSDGAGGFITTQSPTYIGSTDILLFQIPAAATDTEHKYNVPLFPMDGWTLVSVTYTRTGNSDLSVVIRRNGTAIGGTVDPSAVGTITITPNVVANTDTESFSIEIVATRTAVANQSSEVTDVFVTYSISEYSDA